MSKLLALLLLLSTLSGDALAQCCGSWGRVVSGGSGGPSPSPCADFGCYLGDGLATQHVDTNGCTPDAMWVKRRDSDLSGLGLFRTRDMADGDSLRSAPGQSAFYPNGILSFDATGFTVGLDFETNQVGVTYCYYLWQAFPDFMAHGTYTGNNNDNEPLVLPFAPDVFMLYGRADADFYGLRFRTIDVPGDATLLLNASAIFDLPSDEIQAIKSTALGDAYNGVELGTGANAAGRQYFWMAWKKHGVGDWIFTGVAPGTGVAGDASALTINTLCTTDTKFAMTSADTGGVPVSLNVIARYFRHDTVAPDTTNYAQRFANTDLNDEPPGTDSGLREFNTTNFLLANSNNAIVGHQANLLGNFYYYWGLCE